MINPETYTASMSFGSAQRTAGQMPVFGQKREVSAPNTADAAEPAKSAAPAQGGTSFLDFVKGLIDVVNPLQHIPVVSTLYRQLTGDQIAPAARIAGDALFGGPIGAAFGVADAALEHSTGRDIGGTALAMLKGENKNPDTMLAMNAPAQTDIVWHTPEHIEAPTESRLALAPAPAQSSRIDVETASYKESVSDKPAQYAPVLEPVSALKGDARVFTAQTREESRQRPTSADSTVAFLQQNAPAEEGQKPSSPERPAGAPSDERTTSSSTRPAGTISPVPANMVAAKMMEALDKYQAMNRTGLAPRPAVLGAF